MKLSTQLLIGALAAGATACAGAALAQSARPAARPAATGPHPAAATAAAAATPVTLPPGPAIAGLCIFSREQALSTSAVGKFVNTRLQQLQQQAQAEITTDQTALQTDAKAFDARRATLTQDAQQQQELSLQQRDTAWQRKAQVRDRELQMTAEKAYSRVLGEANPLLLQVYAQHNCSVLLDGQSAQTSNPAMNITPEVVRLLDAKITQFPFEREHLEQQAQAAPASAQR